MSNDLSEQSRNDLRRVLAEMESLAPVAPELEDEAAERSTRRRSRPRPILVALGAAFVVFLLAAPLIWLAAGQGGTEADNATISPTGQPETSPATTLPSPDTTAQTVVELRKIPPDSEGTYRYAISYSEAHHTESTGGGWIVPGPDTSVEADGTLTYTVKDGPEEGTKTVTVQAIVSELNQFCGHPPCSDDLFQDIPPYRAIIDSRGRFVRTLSEDTETGWPALVLPDPLPGADLSGGLPFGFGPPIPEEPLDVGDSWTTTGPRSAFAEGGHQFSAEHEVTGRETILGRDTIVISSVYQVPAGGTADGAGNGLDTERAEVTVWFDPEAGIIVRADLDSTTENHDGAVASDSTTQIAVELIEGA